MTTPQEILSSVEQGAEPSGQAGVSAPILITEHEVAFSTAAAASVRPAKTRRWAAATAVVLAGLRRMAVTWRPKKQPSRQYYSRRYDFLENACMAREMERL
jgi:hypothetical protein